LSDLNRRCGTLLGALEVIEIHLSVAIASKGSLDHVKSIAAEALAYAKDARMKCELPRPANSNDDPETQLRAVAREMENEPA